MKILIFGATGFIGRNLCHLLEFDHEIFKTGQNIETNEHSFNVDLEDQESIGVSLKKVCPDVIVSAAGVVANTDEATKNEVFTMNILEQVAKLGLRPSHILICGSSAEYGLVDPEDLPVKETTALHPNSLYGKSKMQETARAAAWSIEHKIPVIVARIFNPIGVGMHPRFLIPALLSQITEVRNGDRDSIEVSRLDAVRDYIDISDLVRAMKVLIEGQPKESIYNIGSGVGTSNSELLDTILTNANLPSKPNIIETSSQPESTVACQADITRISNEFNWKPVKTIQETIKEIVNAQQ